MLANARLALLIAGLSLFAPACRSSMAPPSPTPADATLQSVTITANVGSLTAAGQTVQAVATGTFSNGTSRDVTSTCTNWQSDNAAVLTVNATGRLMAQGTGAATLTATCQNVPARAPLSVALRPTSFTLSGSAIDAFSGGILPNIAVQVTDGVNAGQTTRTDGAGNYVLKGLRAGTFTLSFSAVSYYGATRSVTLSADTRVDITLQRAPTPGPSRLDIELRYRYNGIPCQHTAALQWLVHLDGSITLAGDTVTFSVPPDLGDLKMAMTMTGTRVAGTIVSTASAVLPDPWWQPGQRIPMSVSRQPIYLTGHAIPVPVAGIFDPQGGFTGTFDAQLEIWWFDTMFACQGTYTWSLGFKK